MVVSSCTQVKCYFEVGTCNPTHPVQVFSVVLQPYQWTAKWTVTVYMYVFILKCQMRYKVLDICSLTISSYKCLPEQLRPAVSVPVWDILRRSLWYQSLADFWSDWSSTEQDSVLDHLKVYKPLKADSYSCAICCTIATKLCEISATVVFQKSTHS